MSKERKRGNPFFPGSSSYMETPPTKKKCSFGSLCHLRFWKPKSPAAILGQAHGSIPSRPPSPHASCGPRASRGRGRRSSPAWPGTKASVLVPILAHLVRPSPPTIPPVFGERMSLSKKPKLGSDQEDPGSWLFSPCWTCQNQCSFQTPAVSWSGKKAPLKEWAG